MKVAGQFWCIFVVKISICQTQLSDWQYHKPKGMLNLECLNLHTVTTIQMHL